MSRRVANVTLDNLDDLPPRCRRCVFWELTPVARARAEDSGDPADGPGPNALLQNNPFMAVHPPLLYTGYAGMAVTDLTGDDVVFLAKPYEKETLLRAMRRVRRAARRQDSPGQDS